MKNNIINELRFASKKNKNAVLGYVYCDYLLDMFEEIERLNNIIKEVREYIEEWQRFPHTNGSTHKELKNLIDILDKENK